MKKDLKFAAILMQKNEGSILKVWIEHYIKIFGADCIFIFDNGSTDPVTLEVLKASEAAGISVDYRFSSREDFNSKGSIVVSKVKELDSLGIFDFFFPLDADELIAVDRDGEISFDLMDIEREMMTHLGEKKVLKISYAVDNSPIYEDHYRISPNQKKSFFCQKTINSLDLGFHCGSTIYGSEEKKTNVVYIHLHYRSYSEKVERSREKLLGRVKSFSLKDLEQHRSEKGAGFHLVGEIIDGPEKYYASHKEKNGLVLLPSIRKHLELLSVYSCLSEKMDFHYSAHLQRDCSANWLVGDFNAMRLDASEKVPGMKEILSDHLAGVTSVIEYGSGESTYIAAGYSRDIVYSVESDEQWILNLKERLQNDSNEKVRFIHVNIGRTKEWGYPVNNDKYLNFMEYSMGVWSLKDLIHPDVVLIDGRFRVGCFMATLLNIRRQTKILFNDYVDGPHYHIVEDFLKPVEIIGKLAVFIASPRALHPSEWYRYGPYFLKPD